MIWIVVIWLCLLPCNITEAFLRLSVGEHKASMPLFANKPNKLSSDELKELEKVFSSRQQARPVKGVQSKAVTNIELPPMPASVKRTIPTEIPRLVKPNADWRSALDKPYRPTAVRNIATAPSATVKSVIPMASLKSGMFDNGIPDITQKDVDAAMLRLELGLTDMIRYGASVGKYTMEVEEHDGLYSDDIVPHSLWKHLVDLQGSPTTFENIFADNILMMQRDKQELIVLFVDPYGVSGDFKTMLKEMDNVPVKTLGKVSVVAVTSAEVNDLKKFFKKNSVIRTKILLDPTQDVSIHFVFVFQKCGRLSKLFSSSFCVVCEGIAMYSRRLHQSCHVVVRSIYWSNLKDLV